MSKFVESIQEVQGQPRPVVRLMRKADHRAPTDTAGPADAVKSYWEVMPSSDGWDENSIAPHFKIVPAEVGGADRDWVSERMAQRIG